MFSNFIIKNSNQFENHKNKLNKNNSKKLNSNNFLLYIFDIINNLNNYEPKDISYNVLNTILNPLIFDLKNNLFTNEQLVNNNYYISEYYNLKNNNLNISFNKNDNDFFQIFPNIKDYFNQEKKKKVKVIQLNNKQNPIESRNRTPPLNSYIKKKISSSVNNKQNNLKNGNKKLTTKNTNQIIFSRKCKSPNPKLDLNQNPNFCNKNKNDNIVKHTQFNSFTNENNINNNTNNNVKKNNVHQKLNQNRLQKNNKQKVIILNSLIKQYKKNQKNSPLKSENNNIKKIEHKKYENPKTNKLNLSFTKTTKIKETKSTLNKVNNIKDKIKNSSKEKTKLNKSFDVQNKNDIFETLHNTQIIDCSCLKENSYNNEKLNPQINFIYEDDKKENERNTGYLGQLDFIDRFSFK